jgi:hypothetical protein
MLTRRAPSSSHNIGEFSALVLDIHAAHEQVRLHPESRGAGVGSVSIQSTAHTFTQWRTSEHVSVLGGGREWRR